MPGEEIIKYYLLCSVRAGTRKHIVNELPNKKLNVIFTKKEIDLYLRMQDGNYVAKEVIVGGSDGGSADARILVIE